ncbi:MAG: hypothetical protein K2Z81_04085 [Cyanobacteria bacterium]|nr:hypothetical protein [Cyanobacteriota bacterium]
MTPKDFIFWLQAYFEIPDHKQQPVVLTPRQVKIIRRHLAMLPVSEYDPLTLCGPNYGTSFCDWLVAYLKEADDVFEAAGTLKIQQRLGELFEHAVEH